MCVRHRARHRDQSAFLGSRESSDVPSPVHSFVHSLIQHTHIESSTRYVPGIALTSGSSLCSSHSLRATLALTQAPCSGRPWLWCDGRSPSPWRETVFFKRVRLPRQGGWQGSPSFLGQSHAGDLLGCHPRAHLCGTWGARNRARLNGSKTPGPAASPFHSCCPGELLCHGEPARRRFVWIWDTPTILSPGKSLSRGAWSPGFKSQLGHFLSA